MATEFVSPEDVVVSEFNERQSFDADQMADDELVESVRQNGVTEPPLVRENEDGELAAYVGQRRVAAAKQAGVDEIPVIVNDVSDQNALIASITENTDLFSEAVSPADRAQAIQRLWDMMGGGGTPVFSHIGHTLGVPADTVRTWYEPMREEWSGTSIDPSTESETESEDEDFFSGDETLGERALGEVRRMSEDSDEMEQAAETAAELGATQDDLNEAKDLVDSEGLPADKAIEDIVSDGESTSAIQVSVRFEGDISDTVQEKAEELDMETDELVEDAVRYYVNNIAEAEQRQSVTHQTGSDML
jgi:hypothetical protein